MTRTETFCRVVIACLTLVTPISTAGPQAADDVPAREALARHGAAFSLHMVRVQQQRSVENRRVDGLLVSTQVIPEGPPTAGLVVTSEPLILVTASEILLEPENLNPLLTARTKGLSERQFMLVLKDGSTVEAEVVGRIETLNMLTLRPKNLNSVPDELRHPLSLEHARRPVPGELVGLIAFGTPLRSSQVNPFVFTFPSDRPDYARPVITGAGRGHLLCPVLAVDGSLTGILNLSPKDTTDQVRPEDLDAGSARDPLASVAANKYPFLITGEELKVVLGDLIQKNETVVPYTLLGFRLKSQGDSVRVHSLLDSAAGQPSPLLAGDVVVSLDGTQVKRLEQFDRALEISLERGARQLTLGLERNGKKLEVVLTL